MCLLNYERLQQVHVVIISLFKEAERKNRSLTESAKCGYLFLLGNSMITWASRKQTSVALSSTEAEYIAASQTNYYG